LITLNSLKNAAMSPEISKLDELHDSLRRLTHELSNCPDEDICSFYEQVIIASERTFAQEQLLMEKHDFPACRCHLEQHARVLSALHQAHPSVMRGDRKLALHLGAHLFPEWFELHNATLDAALSVWASYKTDTGVPLLNYRNHKASILHQRQRAR
jgi:hemerythrin